MCEEGEAKLIAEEIVNQAIDETEDSKAMTRSIHISTMGVEVTITSQCPDEDINIMRTITE